MSTLVLVHGFWHGSWCWGKVVPQVVAAGRPVVAVDMAGHGLYARRPRWFTERPYDREAVGTEVSPVADVTLHDAAESLTAQIRRIGGGAPVTVVAHSAACPVLTRTRRSRTTRPLSSRSTPPTRRSCPCPANWPASSPRSA